MKKTLLTLSALLLPMSVLADYWGGYRHYSDCDKILPVILALFILSLAAAAAMGVMVLFGYRDKKQLPYFFGLSFFITPLLTLFFAVCTLAIAEGLREEYFIGLPVFPFIWGCVALVGSIGGLFGLKAGYAKKLWVAVGVSCLVYLIIAVPLAVVYFAYFDQFCRSGW